MCSQLVVRRPPLGSVLSRGDSVQCHPADWDAHLFGGRQPPRPAAVLPEWNVPEDNYRDSSLFQIQNSDGYVGREGGGAADIWRGDPGRGKAHPFLDTVPSDPYAQFGRRVVRLSYGGKGEIRKSSFKKQEHFQNERKCSLEIIEPIKLW